MFVPDCWRSVAAGLPLTLSPAPCYTEGMKPCLIAALLLLLVLAASARQAGAQSREEALTMPPHSLSQAGTLQMDPDERRFFALGATLARAAFAYAELAKAATEVARTRSRLAQVGKLGKLAPLAARNRKTAGEEVARALALMRAMDAPPAALAPVAKAAALLAGPLPITADAKPLLLFNRDAAHALSSLNEFETLSSLPEDPAVRAWLDAPGAARSASVWYGEGEIAALGQIAAAHEMPDLLPPAQQIATDLRGLRDWLALRLPDTPTPEQASLKAALEAFLKETASARPGVRSRKALTPAELQALGAISRQLEAQALGPADEAE